MIFILLFFEFAFASTPKVTKQFEEYLKSNNWVALKSQMLLKAKNEHELDQSLAFISELQRDSETCHEQLKQKSLPLKCFDLLAREKQWGLLTIKSVGDAGNFLDQKCLEAVREIKSLSDPRLSGIKKRNISPRCRTEIIKHRERLRYKAFEDEPNSVFEERWP